jgi:hypothetical protein
VAAMITGQMSDDENIAFSYRRFATEEVVASEEKMVI